MSAGYKEIMTLDKDRIDSYKKVIDKSFSMGEMDRKTHDVFTLVLGFQKKMNKYSSKIKVKELAMNRNIINHFMTIMKYTNKMLIEITESDNQRRINAKANR